MDGFPVAGGSSSGPTWIVLAGVGVHLLAGHAVQGAAPVLKVHRLGFEGSVEGGSGP